VSYRRRRNLQRHRIRKIRALFRPDHQLMRLATVRRLWIRTHSHPLYPIKLEYHPLVSPPPLSSQIQSGSALPVYLYSPSRNICNIALLTSQVQNFIPNTCQKKAPKPTAGAECGQQDRIGHRLRTNTENKPHSLLLAIGSPLGCAKVLIMRESPADGAPISSWGSRLKTNQPAIWENSPI